MNDLQKYQQLSQYRAGIGRATAFTVEVLKPSLCLVVEIIFPNQLN